jgi:hypothetical protein
MRQTWRSERMKKTPTAAIAAGNETLYRYRAKSKDSAPAASAPGEAVWAAIGVDNLGNTNIGAAEVWSDGADCRDSGVARDREEGQRTERKEAWQREFKRNGNGTYLADRWKGACERYIFWLALSSFPFRVCREPHRA